MSESVADNVGLRWSGLYPEKMFPIWSRIWLTINQSGFAFYSVFWVESDTEVWVIADENEWIAGVDLPDNDALYWINTFDEIKNQKHPAYQHPETNGLVSLPIILQTSMMEYSVPVH
jgi:hypothetical protein